MVTQLGKEISAEGIHVYNSESLALMAKFNLSLPLSRSNPFKS